MSGEGTQVETLRSLLAAVLGGEADELNEPHVGVVVDTSADSGLIPGVYAVYGPYPTAAAALAAVSPLADELNATGDDETRWAATVVLCRPVGALEVGQGDGH